MERYTTDSGIAAMAVSALTECGLAGLLSLYPLKRLENVSFLGIVNEVYGLRSKSDRLEHTLSVVYWADKLCTLRAVAKSERRIMLCACLLHDLGHGPFSHNSEPFMIERMRVYHQGLGSLFLQQGNRFGGESQSLKSAIEDALGADAERVIRVLMKDERSTLDPLVEFVESPINVDKIEGNCRSATELGSSFIEPLEMLNILDYYDERFYVRGAALETVIQFWRNERSLYWDKLYTNAVFGGEAVVTRILHLLHDAGTEDEVLVFATDDEVSDMARHVGPARELHARLFGGSIPNALSVTHPLLLDSVLEDLRNSRFDLASRAGIEKRVALQLGIKQALVISHYGRRKYFDEKFSDLFQRDLFDVRSDLIPLRRIRAAFAASKRSADLIDVYYFNE